MDNITNIIMQTINELFNNLFSSINNGIYSTLDSLIYLNDEILNHASFSKILNDTLYNNLILLANSLIIGFILYYSCKLLISNLTFCQVEHPMSYIFKLIIFSILVNSSYFLCEQFVTLNSLISSIIKNIGSNILNTNISFSTLITNLNNIVTTEITEFSIFSIDGIIRSFISIGLFNLIFSYSLRYILVKVLILIAPFAFLSLINSSSSWFFKSWYRALLSLLLLQSFVTIILIVSLSIDYSSSNIISKFLCVGSIYALSKSNTIIKELIGGLSTEVSSNFKNFNKHFSN